MDKPTFQNLLKEVAALEIRSGGVDMNELLNISEQLRDILVWMIRKHGFQIEELGAYLDCDVATAQRLLEALTGKLLVEEVSETQMYVVQVASSRSGRKYRVSDDVWKVFD